MLTEAYEQGRAAAFDGALASVNPYRRALAAWRQWRQGWRDARDELRGPLCDSYPMTEKNPPPDEVINRIAKEVLDLPTLETRRRDRLDFHERAVWQVRQALEAAYQAGLEAAGGTPKVQFATAREALAYARAGRLVAIRMNGANLVVAQGEADRLAAAGVDYGYLGEVNGRIVVVPTS